jgi:N-acetylglucosamine-6-phosphate deacetylase
MNKNYAQAAQTLAKVQNADGVTEYLKALVAARSGNNSEAAAALKAAIAKDPTLSTYAAQDLELLNVSK